MTVAQRKIGQEPLFYKSGLDDNRYKGGDDRFVDCCRRRSMTDHVLRLRDGRLVGYAVFGPAEGRPVIACHGTPGCRLMLRAAAAGAQRLGLRIIAPDRPGYGLSEPRRGRSIAEWAADVD